MTENQEKILAEMKSILENRCLEKLAEGSCDCLDCLDCAIVMLYNAGYRKIEES